MVKFKKLGMCYQDSVNGRSYSGIEFVEEAAKQYHFEIVRFFTLDDFDGKDHEEKVQSLLSCINQLTGKVDAFYLTQ